ncbi:MAG: Tol-Pal system protein TolB, partial [Halomonas sp.]|nr:Tol-Pal system protein TolB [Halomonas sp.]
MQSLNKIWLFCVLLLVSSVASANLTIEITRGSDQALPIGVVPFEGSQGLPEDVAQIVQDDLERSGYFDPLARSDMFEQPSEGDDVQFGTWRSLDVRYLVVGSAEQTDGGFELQFELMD